MKERWNSDFN